jgi:DNA-binding MarR family transcriptional regulator
MVAMMHKMVFAAVRTNTLAPMVRTETMVTERGASSVADDYLTRALATDRQAVVLRDWLLSLVRRDGRDLTARQITAFMSVYMDERIHTVSSLAELLHISRPGVTRLMDRLVQFDLLEREEDREDRRRVLVRQTARGATFFRELVSIGRTVAAEVREAQVAAA